MAQITRIPAGLDITKDRLRAERTPKLQALDIQFMQAQEAGSSTTDIVAKKQLLRDAPAQVENLTTVEELKAVTLPDVGV